MNFKSILVITFSVLLLNACSAGVKVRHLSSDVCLVVPESTTRQEVISFLGQPDSRGMNEEKQEVWSYLTTRKSFLRKTPFLGKYMGSEEYEVVTVTFVGDKVRTCFYRNLNKEEFGKFSSGNEMLQVEE